MIFEIYLLHQLWWYIDTPSFDIFNNNFEVSTLISLLGYFTPYTYFMEQSIIKEGGRNYNTIKTIENVISKPDAS